MNHSIIKLSLALLPLLALNACNGNNISFKVNQKEFEKALKFEGTDFVQIKQYEDDNPAGHIYQYSPTVYFEDFKNILENKLWYEKNESEIWKYYYSYNKIKKEHAENFPSAQTIYEEFGYNLIIENVSFEELEYKNKMYETNFTYVKDEVVVEFKTVLGFNNKKLVYSEFWNLSLSTKAPTSIVELAYKKMTPDLPPEPTLTTYNKD